VELAGAESVRNPKMGPKLPNPKSSDEMAGLIDENEPYDKPRHIVAKYMEPLQAMAKRNCATIMIPSTTISDAGLAIPFLVQNVKRQMNHRYKQGHQSTDLYV
jgi:hypothetical protein